MQIPHRHLATAQPSNIVLGNIQRQLARRTNPRKELINDIIPLVGISWDIRVIRRIGSRDLNKILCLLMNPQLPDRGNNRVVNLWDDGVENEASFPITRGRWRSLIGRFNMDDELPLEIWLFHR